MGGCGRSRLRPKSLSSGLVGPQLGSYVLPSCWVAMYGRNRAQRKPPGPQLDCQTSTLHAESWGAHSAVRSPRTPQWSVFLAAARESTNLGFSSVSRGWRQDSAWPLVVAGKLTALGTVQFRAVFASCRFFSYLSSSSPFSPHELLAGPTFTLLRVSASNYNFDS